MSEEDKQRLTTVLDAETKKVIEEIAKKHEWSASFVVKKILVQAVEDFNQTGKIIGIN